jgi:hypothetical protein
LAITETLVVMGPRLRGDDIGWVRAKGRLGTLGSFSSALCGYDV